MPARQQSRLIGVRHEYEETLMAVVAAGEAAGELRLPTTPTIFVNTLLGAANWTYKWYSPGGDLSPEQLGDDIAAVLLAGLRP